MTREESIKQNAEALRLMRRRRKYDWLLLLLFPPFLIIGLGMMLMGLLAHSKTHSTSND